MAPTGFGEALAERYELRGVIGEGGMATVYRAYDQKHDRIVALKVLHDDLAAELGPERFKREIRIAARLQHPHILSVFDSGEAADRLWFTMPFVNGESLRDRIEREQRLSVDEALRIAREAAQALAYAHKQGVIHRDIKPENILLTEDGATLVADFGIARSMHENTGTTGVSPSLTQTGSAIGTPMYMAPEQAAGETGITAAVDQYALAAVLYEMLTGSTPFTGATAAALMAARFTTGVTPITQQRSDVPEYVDAAVRRALELKPSDRFETITGFTQAVASSINTPPQFAGMSVSGANPPQAAATARAWKLGVVGLAVIATTALGGLFLTRPSAGTSEAGPIRIAVLPFQNLGDTTDAYFADGVADELRGKLLKLPGVEVIARASSVQYARTTKSPQDIAKELDVKYLLTGTIRWERQRSGTNVVHLRPELVYVAEGNPPTTKWQQAFDQPLTDMTAMQVSVAEQVATQLEVAIGVTTRTQLAVAPTTNTDAYDAYLRGMRDNGDDQPAVLRRQIANFERAVSLDAKFAEAWSRLATARSLLHHKGDGTPTLAAEAKLAADRARALDPNGVTSHLALASYYANVVSDMQRAATELRAARAIEPNNPEIITHLGKVIADQGRFDEALVLQETATRLDPRSQQAWADYGGTLRLTRRYTEARVALVRAAALAPSAPVAVLDLVSLSAAMGDPAGASAAIRAGYAHIDPTTLDVYLATYWDNGWLLDDAAQQRVLAAPLSAFDDSRAQQAIVQAQIYRARGDLARARTLAAGAVAEFIALAKAAPDNPEQPLLAAFAAAMAGNAPEARRLVREHEATFARMTNARLVDDSYYAEVRARIAVLNGETDAAFDIIERILRGPGLLGRGHLQLDPMWAPLRSLPRYQRLMAAGGTGK